MTAPSGRRRRIRPLVWMLVALAAAAVLSAPLVSGGICVDSEDPEKSYCADFHTSLIGLPTSIVAWVILSIVLAAAAWLISSYPLRRR
ncbi:hypothetical protein E4V99_15210 [Microbacterium sp. dk485]|uniref:hypothetical protein n=1 Tax=Microbacterium TaxID=33882 RepID=UPI0010748008|nr:MULTISPECIES: hypothetical protein [Microbacterium]TFV82257.1 hypothetical protein E4V99_15210 [Microbacterium sp. dk485]TXK20414.1 hypothetical protein FVP99_01925 [Microbacterium wangchenii]